MIKLVSDENFDGDVLRGLLRRIPDLDVARVQDVGLAQTPDPTILAWAADEQRVLLNHDRETIPGFAYDRVRAGEPMPRVFLVSDHMPKGLAIDQLKDFVVSVHFSVPKAEPTPIIQSASDPNPPRAAFCQGVGT